MAIINYTDQIKYTGKGYLDAKIMPVNSVDDLKTISLTQRFEGLTITVLNNGNPQDYWLVGGITNKCWIPKTNGGDYKKLKLVLEKGFLKLFNDEEELGESVDLNSLFPKPKDDIYINYVDYVTTNDKDENGIFICFEYSNGTKRYLDMSRFLQKLYKQGSGIVIDGDTISIDEAVLGNISKIEQDVSEQKTAITDVKKRLSEIINKINQNSENIQKNKSDIENNQKEILDLKERVDALNIVTEGLTPDNITIGITEDDKKDLYVKILKKEGNMLKIESHDGNNGLYASIPIFCEDDTLK